MDELGTAYHGDLAYAIGLLDPAIDDVLARGLNIARSTGAAQTEGVLLHMTGDLRFVRGDLAGALESLRAAVATLERVGANQSLARVFVSLGRLHRAHGRPATALTYYRRALAIQQAGGDRLMAAQSRNARSIAYAAMGRLDLAVRR